MIERKGIKKEIVGTLRAPDILWKHYGPKIRRSRDSIFVVWIESRESAAETSLILFFLNVAEDEEIKLPPAMLLLNIWGTFECCVDSYLMFEYLPYVHVYSLLPFKLRALNDLSSGCVFLDHFFFWKSNLYALYPFKNHSCPVIKFYKKRKTFLLSIANDTYNFFIVLMEISSINL